MINFIITPLTFEYRGKSVGEIYYNSHCAIVCMVAEKICITNEKLAKFPFYSSLIFYFFKVFSVIV